MWLIIELVVDWGLFFEVGKNFGRLVIVGFVWFEGRVVMVFVSDSFYYGGFWIVDVC